MKSQFQPFFRVKVAFFEKCCIIKLTICKKVCVVMNCTNYLGKDNLTMLTDFYEITMANGFFCTGNGEKTVYFDLFFRTVPDKGGVAITSKI